MEWPGTGPPAAGPVAVVQSMATGSAAGSRVVVSVPHRCRPMPGRGYAESIAAKAAPTRASHALCEPRLPRCPCFCGKRACSRGLAFLQQCRPYAPVFCGSLARRDALAFAGSELARDALRCCSNRPGRMPRFCESGLGRDAFFLVQRPGRPCAPARVRHAFVGSELARDALILVQRPGRLRVQAHPQGRGMLLWERPWPRCLDPGTATGKASHASTPTAVLLQVPGRGLGSGPAQRRWRIHAYSGSPASTSTTPQSSASLPTPITA
jgi:hypothetical protein